MTGWTYQSSGLGNQWTSNNIWEIGYDPQHWEQDADPKTLSTLIRGGNYDYVTNSVHWDNIPSQTLPAFLVSVRQARIFWLLHLALGRPDRINETLYPPREGAI